MSFSIAIDGPAGAGKSTMAREIAKESGALYLDTGAMYRAVALHMLDNGVDIDDTAAVAAAIRDIAVDVRNINGSQRVYCNRKDMTERIREEYVSAAASNVSAVPEVRMALVAKQRAIAADEDIVMDGRDIGTAVLPNADAKIFLTATPEARAKRRYDELIGKGKKADYATVLADLLARDRNDSTRAASPLVKAEDAIELDTTNLDIQASVEAIRAIVLRKKREIHDKGRTQ